MYVGLSPLVTYRYVCLCTDQVSAPPVLYRYGTDEPGGHSSTEHTGQTEEYQVGLIGQLLVRKTIIKPFEMTSLKACRNP